MSERLWGVDWARILPWTIGDVSVELSTFDEILPFVKANAVALFGDEDRRFFVEEMTGAKLRFWAECDVLALRRGGELIGFWGGHPTDWSTYYCRSMSILPEHREGNLATALSTHIHELLVAHGVERVEVDTSIANVPMQRILLRLGLVVTATMSSERWGQILRFTKHFGEESAQVFARQFINVPRYGKGTLNRERREP